MRLIKIEGGKLKIELPGDVAIFLLLRAFLVLHTMKF